MRGRALPLRDAERCIVLICAVRCLQVRGHAWRRECAAERGRRHMEDVD
jgi:hypothetical protein